MFLEIMLSFEISSHAHCEGVYILHSTVCALLTTPSAGDRHHPHRLARAEGTN